MAENARVVVASSNQSKIDEAIKKLVSESSRASQYAPWGYFNHLNSNQVEADLFELLKSVANGEPLNHIITTARRLDARPNADIYHAPLLQNIKCPSSTTTFIASRDVGKSWGK